MVNRPEYNHVKWFSVWNAVHLSPNCKPPQKIPPQDFYHYLQIWHFFLTHYSLAPSDNHTSFEFLSRNAPRQKGLISELYKSIGAIENNSKLKYMSGWEQELNLEFYVQEWAKMPGHVQLHKSLTLWEMAIKLFTHWFYTPLRLYKIYPQVSPSCFRGCALSGSFFIFNLILLWSYNTNKDKFIHT